VGPGNLLLAKIKLRAMAKWYVTIDGQEFGPLNNAQLKKAASTGRVTPQTPLRQESMSVTVPASQVKGLFDQESTSTPPSNPTQASPPPPVDQPSPSTPPLAPAQPPSSAEPPTKAPIPLAEVEPGPTSVAESTDNPAALPTHEAGEAKATPDDNEEILLAEPDPPAVAPVSAPQRATYEAYQPPGNAASDALSGDFTPETPAPPPTTNFFAALPGAFLYPFKGSGALIIFLLAFMTIAVPYVLAIAVSSLAPVGVSIFLFQNIVFFIYVLMALALLIQIYLTAYVFRIGRSTVEGDDVPPPLPDFGKSTDEILFPAFLYGATAIACALPFAFYAWERIPGIPSFSYLWMTYMQFQMLIHTWPTDILGWILRVPGLIYFPMALMAVTALGSLSGLEPRLVLRAIRRAPGACAVAVAFVSGKFIILAAITVFLLAPAVSQFELPSTIAIFLMVAITLYLLMVQGRIIGLLYRCHPDKREL